MKRQIYIKTGNLLFDLMHSCQLYIFTSLHASVIIERKIHWLEYCIIFIFLDCFVFKGFFFFFFHPPPIPSISCAIHHILPHLHFTHFPPSPFHFSYFIVLTRIFLSPFLPLTLSIFFPSFSSSVIFPPSPPCLPSPPLSTLH